MSSRVGAAGHALVPTFVLTLPLGTKIDCRSVSLFTVNDFFPLNKSTGFGIHAEKVVTRLIFSLHDSVLHSARAQRVVSA